MRFYSSLLGLWIALSCVFGHADELNELLAQPEMSARLDDMTKTRESLNHVEILHLGHTSRPKRVELMNKAEKFILIKMPYWYNDQTGNEQIELLRKAKERNPNIDIRVVYDWFTPAQSGQMFKQPVFNALDALLGKANIMSWSPIYWQRTFSFSVLANRLHDKVLVVDGKSAIIGGLNFADHYLLGGEDRHAWHDTDVLLQGPAARELTRLFNITWEFGRQFRGSTLYPPTDSDRARVLQDIYWDQKQETTFRVLDNPQARDPRKWMTTHKIYVPWKDKYDQQIYNPELTAEEASAQIPVRVIYDNTILDQDKKTGKHFSKIGRVIRELLKHTKNHVQMIMPYPTLTRDTREALIETAQRGVRVEILTNSLESHDLGDSVYLGSLHDMKALLEGGVDLYEWRGHTDLFKIEKENGCTIDSGWTGHTIHTKGISFDGQVLLIGSHNFNYRSEKYNNEVAALISSPEHAQEFEMIWGNDVDQVGPHAPVLCGGVAYDRPPKVRQLTDEIVKKEIRKHGFWIDILSHFKIIM